MRESSLGYCASKFRVHTGSSLVFPPLFPLGLVVLRFGDMKEEMMLDINCESGTSFSVVVVSSAIGQPCVRANCLTQLSMVASICLTSVNRPSKESCCGLSMSRNLRSSSSLNSTNPRNWSRCANGMMSGNSDFAPRVSTHCPCLRSCIPEYSGIVLCSSSGASRLSWCNSTNLSICSSRSVSSIASAWNCMTFLFSLYCHGCVCHHCGIPMRSVLLFGLLIVTCSSPF